MDRFLKRLITFLVSLFLIFYVGYQAFLVIYNPIITETVYDYSVYDTIDTEGLAIRKEDVLEGNYNGYLSYVIDNGHRVSKNGKVADVYANEADSRVGQKIQRVEHEIKVLEDIQAQGSAQRTHLDVFEKQLHQTIGNMANDANANTIENMNEWQSKLLELVNKRQMTVGTVENFSERIAQLKSTKLQLESSAGKTTGSINSAQGSGYFVNTVDGYENVVNYDKVKDLTTTNLKELLSKPPEIPKNSVGKVVGEYTWYFACVIDAKQSGTLKQGDVEYELYFPFVSREAVPFTIHSINRNPDGDSVVIFESSYMDGALAEIRRETVQIRLSKYTGLRLPTQSVHSGQEEGEHGVFVLVGNTVVYKKIKIKHPEPDFVICDLDVFDENGKPQSGYLKLYDEIIVEGKGLYDGKPIR